MHTTEEQVCDTAVELRQLAMDIEDLARNSPVSGIVYQWIRTLTNHLQAVARVHETRTFKA